MLSQLKNTYYGLRHGQSQANVERVIVSHPDTACDHYGLTDQGRQQVMETLDAISLPSDSLIITSDFKRAKETAELACASLGCDKPIIDTRLRERFFGIWDMKPDTSYTTIWEKDGLDPCQTIGNVESAARVCERILDLIESIEMEAEGRAVLLVSHGDPLQLAQTIFFGLEPSEHRNISPWKTAELRRLGG